MVLGSFGFRVETSSFGGFCIELNVGIQSFCVCGLSGFRV